MKLTSSTEIRPFVLADTQAFRSLNLQWITKYFVVEQADLDVLDDPIEAIIKRGGRILIAESDEETVGCCALLKHDAKRFELAKMAVAEAYQGNNIGYELGTEALRLAKTLGAHSVVLETNSCLKPAVALYHKLGFQLVPKHDTPFERCNLQMEHLFAE